MSQAPEDGCTNIRNMLSSEQWNNKASDIKLVYLYSTERKIYLVTGEGKNKRINKPKSYTIHRNYKQSNVILYSPTRSF